MPERQDTPSASSGSTGAGARPLAFHLRDAGQTEQFGEVLGDLLRDAQRHPGAVCLLLSGDLGAGKTTLVRGLARGLGCDERAVASPTFTLRMDHAGATRDLAHIDAWRIGPDDLASIGWEDLVGGTAVIALEWPERLAGSLPARSVRLSLEHAISPADALRNDARDHVRDGAFDRSLDGSPDRSPDRSHDGSIAESFDRGGDEDREATEPGRTLCIDLGALPPRESARLEEGLRLLVRAARIASPSCPTCGRPIAPQGAAEAGDSGGGASSNAPFCSRRCRMADLGDWLLMRHRIAGSETPEFDE